MDDLWVRMALVALVLLLAVSAALWQRRTARHPVSDISSSDLLPGVYFFSSESCPTCAAARDQLDRVLGQSSYTEVRWEDQPALFGQLGVDAVPAVLIVKVPGRGRLYPGQPQRALAEL